MRHNSFQWDTLHVPTSSSCSNVNVHNVDLLIYGRWLNAQNATNHSRNGTWNVTYNSDIQMIFVNDIRKKSIKKNFASKYILLFYASLSYINGFQTECVFLVLYKDRHISKTPYSLCKFSVPSSCRPLLISCFFS